MFKLIIFRERQEKKINLKELRFTLEFNICYNYRVTNLNTKNNNQNDSLIVDGDILKYKMNKITKDEELEHLIDVGEQLVDENIVSLVLLDFSGVDKISLKMRTKGIQFLKNPQIKKIAIFGCNQFIKTTVTFLIKFVNKHKTIVFDNEEDSLAWLKS